MRPMNSPIELAAEAVGGITNLATALSESPQAVSNWRKRGVPLVRCSDIERATGGAVSRRDLRPDDWHRIWPELVTHEHPAPEADQKEEGGRVAA